MRLIDADRLLTNRMKSKYYHLPNGDIAIPLIDIEHAPTIEERKKGRWIRMSDADGDYYCCSQCGEELPRYMTELPSWDRPYPHKQSIDKTNFCLNCGSDMRGTPDDQS